MADPLDLEREKTMEELDPSPVEETPSNDPPSTGKGYFPPHHSSSSSSTSSTLGLHSTSLPSLLHALQKYSTLPPTLYLLAHITNTSLLPLLTQSVPKSETYLLLTRPYYQSFPLEPLLLLAPTATHVLSGIALRIYHRRQAVLRHGGDESSTYAERRKIPWPKVSLQSALGYALYPLVAGHVFVNRILPLRVEGGSSGVGLGYVAHGFAKHPLLANAGYMALIGVASAHVVGGAARWLGLGRESVTEGGDYGARKRRRRGWVVNGVVVGVAALWMAGGLGVVGRGGLGTGWEAKNWDGLYSRVPVFGAWLS